MNSIRNSISTSSSAANLKATILKNKSDSSFNGGDFSDFNMLTMAAAAASSYDSSRSTPPKRRKQDPKTGKGLRHFSMKVRSTFDHLFWYPDEASGAPSSAGRLTHIFHADYRLLITSLFISRCVKR